MKKGIVFLITIILVFSLVIIGISKTNNQSQSEEKIKIIATLFPQYDFAKQIGGDKVEVSLLLTPGTETHTYEPTPQDIINVNKADLYIYMPTIVKGNYKNLFFSNVENAIKKYSIQGFVISNICNIMLLNSIFNDLNKYFKIISNYTFNVFNKYTVLELKKLGISTYTLSPELDKDTIFDLSNYNYLKKELIVYGKTPVLNMNYCLLRRI